MRLSHGLIALVLSALGCSLSIPPAPGVHQADMASQHVDSAVAASDVDGDGVFDAYDQCPITPQGMRPDAVRIGCPEATVINLENNDPSTYVLEHVSYIAPEYDSEASIDPVTRTAPDNHVTIPFDVSAYAGVGDEFDVSDVLIRVAVDLSVPAMGACVDGYSDAAPDASSSSGFSCVPRYVSSRLLDSKYGVMSVQAIPVPSSYDSNKTGPVNLGTPSYVQTVRLPDATRQFYAQLVLRGRVHALRILSVTAKVTVSASR